MRDERTTYFSATEEQTPSSAVVEAVATVTDHPVTEMQPLYEQIDPDALDALVCRGDVERNLSVSFSYLGHEVTVHQDGLVAVTVPDDQDGERRDC